ncbi:MAG: histidine phosphatase family protein, partial [Mycobacterium sp.]
MFIASPITAWAATSITLTWVRHGQSVDNVYHELGTVAPGPTLSSCEADGTPCVDQPDAVPGPKIEAGYTQTAPGGVQEAVALRDKLLLSPVAYDAIYASTLIRTQETAAPYAQASGLQITVLDGLRETRAGADEGAITNPPDAKMNNYIAVQDAWRLGQALTPMPQDPNPADPNPATNANGDVNGLVFNDRTNTAVQKIYWDEMNKYPMFTADAVNPDANPLAFSHNGTITTWIEMNVKNPLDLAYLRANSLKNTEMAVVVGNPTDGWTLVSWKGAPVSATPTLGMAFFVTFRDYGFVVERSIWNVQVAQSTGDFGQVLQALGTGLAQDLVATIALPGQLVQDVTNEVVHALAPNAAGAAQPARAVAAATAVAARGGATVTPIAARRTPAAARAAAATAKQTPAAVASAAVKRARQAA